MAREIVETGEKRQIEKLVKLMQGHESQQSATIIATIAILIGEKMETKEISVSKECSKALGDIILWNTPVIMSRETWPSRHHYSFMQIFSYPEKMLETKMVVHGYLGNKASREMEQFYSEGELKRIAHYENGIWIAPTRSTFKSYLSDIFPERPYIIHQNDTDVYS